MKMYISQTPGWNIDCQGIVRDSRASSEPCCQLNNLNGKAIRCSPWLRRGDRGNCGSYTQVCTSKIRLGKAWKRNLENTRNQNQKVKPKGCWNMTKAISFELSPHAHGFTSCHELARNHGRENMWRGADAVAFVGQVCLHNSSAICCTLKNIQLKKGVATQIGW